MRIAMLVTHDYTGGTALWAKEFISGLIDNGFDVTVLKSRRQKMVMLPELAGDQHHEFSLINTEDVVKTLRSENVDFAIIQSAFDAQKQATKYPMWNRAFGDMPVPFTFCTHDDAASYSSVHGKYVLGKLFDDPNFCGTFLGFSQLPDELYGGRAKQYTSVLPFSEHGHEMVPDVERTLEQVALFSQVCKVKQWSMIFRAAVLSDQSTLVHPDTSNPFTYTLTGSAISSPGTSATTRMWELMEEKFGATPVDLDVSDPASNPHKPIPWNMILPNGTQISYTGRFDGHNVHEKMGEAGMAVNTTTRRGGSLGPTEYVTLEAIRAGTPVVAPEQNAHSHEHLMLSSYVSFTERHLTTPEILKGNRDDTILDMLETMDYERERDEKFRVARRSRMLAVHSPKRVVADAMNALGIG